MGLEKASMLVVVVGFLIINITAIIKLDFFFIRVGWLVMAIGILLYMLSLYLKLRILKRRNNDG